MGILFFILVVLLIGISIGSLILWTRVMERALQESRGWKLSTVGKILIVAGCIAIVISVCNLIYTALFVHSAAHATGIVTQMREHKDKDSGAIGYAPTFEFQDTSGQKHAIDSHLYSRPPDHHIGETVGVLYRPTKPDDACIDTFSDVWGLAILLGVMGLLQIPTGLIFLNLPRIKAWWQAKTG